MISAVAEPEAQYAAGCTEAVEGSRRRATRGDSARRSKEPAKKASGAKKRAKAPTGARSGSKSADVIALLRRTKGATIDELMKVTGWQAHSVRGFLSGTIGKKMGLKLTSEKREDGSRVYSLSD